ncbi:hypothetical protein TNCV_703371 [Trichonephila clavipes]|nr:hypothetical protein TNCV_703371 [Trichonephila clavipes]
MVSDSNVNANATVIMMVQWIKINRLNILEPIFEEEIPTLYGKDIDKVEFHMDKASSQTYKSNADYLEKKEETEE